MNEWMNLISSVTAHSHPDPYGLSRSLGRPRTLVAEPCQHFKIKIHFEKQQQQATKRRRNKHGRYYFMTRKINDQAKLEKARWIKKGSGQSSTGKRTIMKKSAGIHEEMFLISTSQKNHKINH